jgi:hypothetical protein
VTVPGFYSSPNHPPNKPDDSNPKLPSPQTRGESASIAEPLEVLVITSHSGKSMQIESIRLKNFRAYKDVTMKDTPERKVRAALSDRRSRRITDELHIDERDGSAR